MVSKYLTYLVRFIQKSKFDSSHTEESTNRQQLNERNSMLSNKVVRNENATYLRSDHSKQPFHSRQNSLY